MNLTRELYYQIVDEEILESLGETLALETTFKKIAFLSGYIISLVNLVVFILSCLLCRIHEIRTPSLVFVANLSLCDALLSFSNGVTSKFSIEELLDVKYLSVAIVGSMAESIREERCKIALSILTVSMGNSLSALALLTIDRYLTIKYHLHYSSLMNVKKAGWMVGLNWFVWFTFGIISYAVKRKVDKTFEFSMERECQLASLVLFNIILLTVFLAYRKILSEFFVKKFYLEKLEKGLDEPQYSVPNKISFSATKNYVIPLQIESQLKVLAKIPAQIKSIDFKNENGRIQKTLCEQRRGEQRRPKHNKLSPSLSFYAKYIKSSKYIIAILTVFCVLHLPLFVYVCIEMIRSYTGYYESLHSTICDQNASTGYQWKNEKGHNGFVGDCLRLLISNKDDSSVCLFPDEPSTSDSSYLCHLIHQGTYELFSVSKMTIFFSIGVYNAAINPLLYAIWFSQFRDGVTRLLTRPKLTLSNDNK